MPPLRALSLRLAVFSALSVLLAMLVSPRVPVPTDQYQLGDFTTASLRAPQDFSVTDEAATERRRDEATRQALPVARFDASVADRAKAQITDAFAEAARPFAAAAARREVPARALQGVSRAKRQSLQASRAAEADRWLAEQLPDTLRAFERAVGVTLTPGERDQFAAQGFGPSLSAAASSVIDDRYRRRLADNLAAIAEAARGDAEKTGTEGRVALRDTRTGLETIAEVASLGDFEAALQSLPDRAEALAPALAPAARDAIVRILRAQMRPSIVLDVEASAERRAALSAAVTPVVLTFRKNQLIIGEGQQVTDQTLLAVAYLRNLSRSVVFFRRFIGSTLLLSLLTVLAFWRPRGEGRGQRADRDLLFLATGLAGAAVCFWVWLEIVDGLVVRSRAAPELALVLVFPLGAAAMLTRYLIDFETAALQLVVFAATVGLASNFGLLLTAYTMVVGLVGVRLVAGCVRRTCLLGAGLYSGAVSAAAAVCLWMLVDDRAAAGAWPPVLMAALVGGALSGVAVVAMSPGAEGLFGYTTSISLVEMLNYDHPLLKRLMAEAPGTFQHSINVGVLGAAAAEAIGVNALLVRVGALYHDTGKMLQPAFFVENQSAFNPHDGLAPAESARVLRNHVLEGTRLVREYGLGERVVDFVLEHHGRGLMRYFAERAAHDGSLAGDEDFRYPGPHPRSKETGILMMADQIEATARVVTNGGESEWRDMVRRTIDRIRSEGEFDECPLTLGDLHQVEVAFVQVLVGMHHQRVVYPPPPTAHAPAG